MSKPLILSPAGSPEALYAALNAGADEIYFGLEAFNARGNAKNFTKDEAREAFRACRASGVKTNITLNTLVTDRELAAAVQLAYDAASMGADAFIVQDLGLARALKRAIPSLTLHASTQCACHSVKGAQALLEAGFSRVVLARELDENEIRQIVALGAETEVFVHGALCVCHSGLCLMSSVIGKRSGNRGLCAQPCRLPYTLSGEKKPGYPLSLKDLSLSAHVPTLSALGITSLKLEGRMKPPAYVAGVTEIWKELVSQNRPATPEEKARLEALFSRQGFTDGYFTGAYRTDNRTMYGVRTEEDKRKSEVYAATSILPLSKKRSVRMTGTFCVGQPPVLGLATTDGETAQVVVQGEAPVQAAASQPMTQTQLSEALTKLGNTPFGCTDIRLDVIGDVFLPKSQLNALRRKAVEALENRLTTVTPPAFYPETLPHPHAQAPHAAFSGKLRLYPQSLQGLSSLLARYADGKNRIESVCLPLKWFDTDRAPDLSPLTARGLSFGVRMPRVVFSAEEAAAERALKRAKEAGALYAVAENSGDIALISAAGLAVYGGASLNVYNSMTLAALAECGVKNITLSPELNTAQLRDLIRPDNTETTLIGAGCLELMVLESCIVRAGDRCHKKANGEICSTLTDRLGMRFPIRSEQRLGEKDYPCRNILLNSVSLRLLEKPEELAKARVDVAGVYEDAADFGENT